MLVATVQYLNSFQVMTIIRSCNTRCVPTELLRHCKISIALIYIREIFKKCTIFQNFFTRWCHCVLTATEVGEVLSSSAASNCVPLDLYSRCIRVVFLWRSYSTGLREVSVQAHSTYHCVFTAIITWECQRSFSGAAEDLITLPRRPHFVSTSFLSERRGWAVEWRSERPFRDNSRCRCVVAPLLENVRRAARRSGFLIDAARLL